MAPEPEVLKRKRSRPSDWWANGSIIASTPQQLRPPPPQEEPEPGPAKKRGRPSISKLQDAPAAGNRRNVAKKRLLDPDPQDENGEDELANDKPLRRGRSSATEAELLSVVGPSKDVRDVQTVKNKRGRPAVVQTVEEGDADAVSRDHLGPNKHGRSRTAQAGNNTPIYSEPTASQAMSKKRGRPSITRANKASEDEDPPSAGKSLRRGHSSNTESEIRATVPQSVPIVTEPKKRGRRHAIEEDAQEINDQEAHRKPGRRPAAEKEADDVNQVPSDAQKGAKKRGQRPVETTTWEESEEPVVAAVSKRRTRRSNTSLLGQESAPSSKNDEIERGRTRTRLSDAKTVEPKVIAPRIPSEEHRGRRRTRLSDAQSQRATLSPAMKNRRDKDRKHSRQPWSRTGTTTTIVETASSKLTKAPSKSKKVGPTASHIPTNFQGSRKTQQRIPPSRSNANEQVDIQSSHSRRKSIKGTSAPEAAIRKRKEPDNHENTPNKRRRLDKKARQVEVGSPETEEIPMLYQHLRLESRKVSLQTIDAKWEPLPPACIERISQLVQDLQRPVLVHLKDDRKKTQAGTALQMISRRLVNKISKGLPFPPATRNHREEDFDFEKILDHSRELEAQLTPVLHGNELLEAELAKETAWLEADKDMLAELEVNAKSEGIARTEAARKVHALLQSDESTLAIEGLKDDVGVEHNEQRSVPLDLHIQGDENLQGLMKGLHGHVETIQGNIKQVSGISEAISRSKAAVQAMLFGHLGGTQYREAILGSD
ncbi:hypothetical protein EG329_013118 [Mollisiaceae sp. DMI_Dod_QoI]|nr:hypothetical protein EG329_013118 [Helotiales sp. DMI_Dod_QoI]